MNQIMINRFNLSTLKSNSIINIIDNNSKSFLLKDIIDHLPQCNTITIFTNNQTRDYQLNNALIYEDTLSLNKVVENIIKVRKEEITEEKEAKKEKKDKKELLIFDHIESLYNGYYIIPELLKVSKSLNITTIIIDRCAKIPRSFVEHIDYLFLSRYDENSENDNKYKRKLYKLYGQVLEEYTQFTEIYKDICQEGNNSLVFDYKQNYYIPERVLSWI